MIYHFVTKHLIILNAECRCFNVGMPIHFNLKHFKFWAFQICQRSPIFICQLWVIFIDNWFKCFKTDLKHPNCFECFHKALNIRSFLKSCICKWSASKYLSKLNCYGNYNLLSSVFSFIPLFWLQIFACFFKSLKALSRITTCIVLMVYL